MDRFKFVIVMAVSLAVIVSACDVVDKNGRAEARRVDTVAIFPEAEAPAPEALVVDTCAGIDSADQKRSRSITSAPETCGEVEEKCEYMTLDLLEFKIPYAIDSIAKALRSFSAEFKDWNYHLSMSSYRPGLIILVGDEQDRNISTYPHLKIIDKHLGYITIDGKNIIVEYCCTDGDMEKPYKIVKPTGKKKTFRFDICNSAVVDGTVEYDMEITDQGINLLQKHEAW